MPTQPLERVVKAAVLAAIVEADYNLDRAFRDLGIGRTTLYRKLRGWGLRPPMWAPTRNGKVLRRDYVARCEAIHAALRELEAGTFRALP